MTKLTKHTRHIINWNPLAHNVVRGCTEPYDRGEVYKHGRVDQGQINHNFTVAESRTKREKRHANEVK